MPSYSLLLLALSFGIKQLTQKLLGYKKRQLQEAQSEEGSAHRS
jgi:hypothetical protein